VLSRAIEVSHHPAWLACLGANLAEENAAGKEGDTGYNSYDYKERFVHSYLLL
jgi:hypothetical protein